MSFTLYSYVLSGNCYKVGLLAALLGVDFKTIAVDFHPGGEHKTEAILRLNPAGTLPILTAGDMVLSETPAMLAWLAKKFDTSGSWWPSDNAEKTAEILQWMGFAGTLTGTIGELRLHSMINREIDVDQARAGSRAALRRLEERLSEQALSGSAWLVGTEPTVADIACFPYTALSGDAGLEHDPYPAIRNWLYALKSLDGFITMPGIHALHELRDGETDHG